MKKVLFAALYLACLAWFVFRGYWWMVAGSIIATLIVVCIRAVVTADIPEDDFER